MPYKPEPIDTSKIALPPYLEAIVEKLAMSIHDNWAQQRLSEGWKYGPQRNDLRKEHPCLVPYAELPEEEKEYDRRTLTESIKMLIACGCIIKTPETGDDPDAELSTVESFRERGRILRRSGDALAAYDAIEKGLSRWSQDKHLLQLKALVLADLGVLAAAREILLRLTAAGHDDEETLGILARTYKEEWLQAPDQRMQKKYLRLAYMTYRQSYTATGGYYPGINAATLALLLGKSATARKIAGAVCRDCLEKLADPEERGKAEYYLTATLAEAYLILNDYQESRKYYTRTGILGKGLHQDLQATRKNARFLIDYLGIDGAEIEKALQLPRIAVLLSDGTNDGGKAAGQLRQDIAGEVKRISGILARNGIGIGFSSAKAGTDLCFLTALRDCRAEAYIVMPFNRDRFVSSCLGKGGRAVWQEIFAEIFPVLHQAERVSFASDWPIGKAEDAFIYANQYLVGLAMLKARQLDTGLCLLTSLSPADRQEKGPAEATLSWLRNAGFAGEAIALPAGGTGRAPGKTGPRNREKEKEEYDREFPTRIMSIFFADVVGYSKMHEGYVPRFVKEFMGAVADSINRSDCRPETRNTWGDAFYFIFRNIRDAGVFALEVADIVSRTSWEERGLPKDLNLRISLHAGPVFHCLDPVTEREMYTGGHVSRAARIEPITPPGQVYCSQAFAALAAACQIREFSCEYVGKVNYAKGYGKFSTYRVRRNYGPRGGKRD